jgi:DeoR/GlpR family transcriptional regulator of sugar metabolism
LEIISTGLNTYLLSLHLTPHWGGVGKLFACTNSLAVISVLSRLPIVRLFILGGEYDSAR